MPAPSTLQAESLIRTTHARVTTTRVKALDFLLALSRSHTLHDAVEG